MLVSSYFTSIIVRAETINGAAILSAKIISDDSEQPQLLLDVALTNQTNEPIKRNKNGSCQAKRSRRKTRGIRLSN